MRYLVKVVEVYRLATEKEAEDFLLELKKDPHFEITKYSSVKKQLKSKGEVVDEWIRLEITKVFNEEKEPDSFINVEYTRGAGYED